MINIKYCVIHLEELRLLRDTSNCFVYVNQNNQYNQYTCIVDNCNININLIEGKWCKRHYYQNQKQNHYQYLDSFGNFTKCDYPLCKYEGFTDKDIKGFWCSRHIKNKFNNSTCNVEDCPIRTELIYHDGKKWCNIHLEIYACEEFRKVNTTCEVDFCLRTKDLIMFNDMILCIPHHSKISNKNVTCNIDNCSKTGQLLNYNGKKWCSFHYHSWGSESCQFDDCLKRTKLITYNDKKFCRKHFEYHRMKNLKTDNNNSCDGCIDRIKFPLQSGKKWCDKHHSSHLESLLQQRITSDTKSVTNNDNNNNNNNDNNNDNDDDDNNNNNDKNDNDNNDYTNNIESPKILSYVDIVKRKLNISNENVEHEKHNSSHNSTILSYASIVKNKLKNKDDKMDKDKKVEDKKDKDKKDKDKKDKDNKVEDKDKKIKDKKVKDKDKDKKEKDKDKKGGDGIDKDKKDKNLKYVDIVKINNPNVINVINDVNDVDGANDINYITRDNADIIFDSANILNLIDQCKNNKLWGPTVLNKKGKEVCHANKCKLYKQLHEKYQGKWCDNHLEEITKIRAIINKHDGNINEMIARFKELNLRRYNDINHLTWAIIMFKNINNK
jgi:hypothetical protein